MKISNILSEVQITYSSKVPIENRHKITCSDDSVNVLRKIWPSYEHVEFFYVLLLNRANHVLSYYMVSKGGISGTVVDVKVIYQVAIKTNTSAIILAHNHPSGNTKPSKSDIEITRKIKEAGKLFDIVVLDHIILTATDSFSFADDLQI